MKYASEKSNLELDVIVLDPEEFDMFNSIFQKVIKDRNPEMSSKFIRPINRVLVTDSLNSVDFVIKTVKENERDQKIEEENHDRIEREYQTEKLEKYS